MLNKLLSIYYIIRNRYWLFMGHSLINRQSPTCQPLIYKSSCGYRVLGCSRYPIGFHKSCPYRMDSPYWQILY